MAKESSDIDMTGDRNRIARDYAFARMEFMESTDLQGYCLQDVKDIEQSFHEAQIELLSTLSKHESSAELKIAASFEQKVKSIKVRMRLDQRLTSDCKPFVANSTSSSFSAKLPKINITPFDGKIENWVSFIQLFDSLIHSKEHIPAVEKLHYLLSNVKGYALDLIKNYPISNENYLCAYNTLKSYYSKKRTIGITFYEKLLDCEPVKSKHSSDLNKIHRTFKENLEILEKYQLPDRDFMLFHLLWSKLDVATKECFELQLADDVDIPKYEELSKFILKRSQALQNSNVKSNIVVTKPNYNHFTRSAQNKSNNKSSFVVSAVNHCDLCSVTGHSIVNCPKFLELTPTGRYARVKEKRLCILCLNSLHTVKSCNSSILCGKCNYRHHTLLHFCKQEENPQQPSSAASLVVPGVDSQVLFSTAIVLAKNKFGKFTPLRILLDSASACNFITLNCARKLGLVIKSNGQTVNGIGQVSTNTLGSVDCEFVPSNSDFTSKFSLEAFVLSQICSDMPLGHIDVSSWRHIKDIDLADPLFYKPGPIDMLVNVNLLASALQPGLIKGEPGQPVAIRTVFGWVIMGECAEVNGKGSCRSRPRSCIASKSCLLVSNLSLDDTMKRFWEVETLDYPKPIVSQSDLSCNNYMESSHFRNPNGRMVVPLTFVDPLDKPQFNNSREIAMKRLLNLERKFKINSQFYKAYVDFMNDYENSGHMEEVEAPLSSSGHFYYIPHHGILRPDSTTTPLRTVFDASAKDASGLSLNDSLLPGPKLQNNIFDLLVRFRWHAVVFTGDIKQMYRQFLVDRSDCDYQRILWRPSQSEPVKDFRLLTVTYGVTCAPYQAIWCLSKLSKEFSCRFPRGASILARDAFVDDVVSGADSVESALLAKKELLQILSSARLHLRKWASNSVDFLNSCPEDDLYSERFRAFEGMCDLSLKILGLSWFPKEDAFTFKTSLNECPCTKRSILSEIARIFDPLGLLSPVVFFAKYLIQLLWISGTDWDCEVPEDIARKWREFKSQLSLLSSISIPRRMIEFFVSIQLHGFCDASEKGYCAVIYCRVVKGDGSIIVRLGCAKSKVAPLRRCSIPRLELLSAVLLSDLLASFMEALKDCHTFDNIFAWSDSSVALTWIRSCPSKWKTFVANRVAHVQEKVPPQRWHHIAGSENPADCGSRGLSPADLLQNVLWWAGPHWLSHPQDLWPQSVVSFDGSASDEEKIHSFVTINDVSLVDQILKKKSSLQRILRIVAYCFRFVHNLKRSSLKHTTLKLSCQETNDALRFLVKHVQECCFASVLRCLSEERSSHLLSKPMRKLSPFLDEHGVLRVGGRLAKGDLTFDVKHPILLPRDSRLTTLIIEDYHRRFMHPGLQTLQNLLVQEFWVLSSKRAIHAVVSSCIKCFRVHPKTASPPLMGNLPDFRINQIKPFSSVAVDFGGPFDISLGRGRGLRTFKSYICVFVCTATKATHLELVSELSSEAYLAALRRFIARRGRCSRLVSDQGRNFVGASNILHDLMAKATHAEQIEFVLNPPGSPHMSGLAEAGIKSVKTHLYRVIGLQRLTFEEFYTVVTQIEAMLNSRPLSPISSDPNDFSVLTPGHFLTLEPLTILPESNLVEQNISVLQRWKLLQQIHQNFWRKWHLEYLHTLQQRNKWFDKKESNISVGTLVLIVNEQCSPMKWKVGRIVKLHCGTDGICRVVTVRTDSGEFKRPVVKLCPLPMQNH